MLHNLSNRDKILGFLFLCRAASSCWQVTIFYQASVYVRFLILKSRMYTQDIPTSSLCILSISLPAPSPCSVWCQSHFAAIICHFQHSSCSLQFNWWLFLSCSLIVTLHLNYSAVKILIIALSMLFCGMKVVQLCLSQFGADVDVSWMTIYWLEQPFSCCIKD